MKFRFQFQIAPNRWEDVGSVRGEGHGAQASGAAIQALMDFHGDQLRPGTYRYRPLDRVTHEWRMLTLEATATTSKPATGMVNRADSAPPSP